MPKILIADDDPQILRALRITLTAKGYQIVTATDGEQAIAAAIDQHPDLVMLDLGMPALDGVQVIAALRGWSTCPILVVSGRTGAADKVEALDVGADDYVTKPFAIQEFLARVRVLLRQAGPGEPEAARIASGPLCVDFAYRRVTLDDVEVALTRKEYAVLAMLARHIGRVVTQQQLLKDIWGPTHVEDSHYLRVVVGHLRQKLGDDPAAPRFIVTEAGVGYRLREL